MAISQVGNIAYINQNSQANAQIQANTLNQTIAQNLANIQEFSDKIAENVEVRPTEEIEQIDKDSNPKHNQNAENSAEDSANATNSADSTESAPKEARENIYPTGDNLTLDIEV